MQQSLVMFIPLPVFIGVKNVLFCVIIQYCHVLFELSDLLFSVINQQSSILCYSGTSLSLYSHNALFFALADPLYLVQTQLSPTVDVKECLIIYTHTSLTLLYTCSWSSAAYTQSKLLLWALPQLFSDLYIQQCCTLKLFQQAHIFLTYSQWSPVLTISYNLSMHSANSCIQ